MVDLNPAPDTLGLASPALGAWFNNGGTLPTLGTPNPTLSVDLTLTANMEWRAPAGCTLSYFIVTDPRPRQIAHLRQADGTQAFSVGQMVLLLTLLPEVEQRLAAITNGIIPAVNGNAPAPGLSSRAVVRYLAFEIPPPASVDAIELLRDGDLPAGLTGDAARAAYLGLTFESGSWGNARKPIAELHRPGFDSVIVLENRSGASLAGLLWAFDDRGRAIDPGAVANWWSFLASGDPQFDNLWADDADSGLQRTAAVIDGRFVLLCAANEGPANTTFLNRLTPSGLTAVSSSTILFQAADTPALALTTAPTPDDDMPIPQVATLPTGPYAAPGTAALFNGWTGGGFPTGLARDFARIAVLDIESHLVGLTRNDPLQADSDSRIPALANTAANPFLATAEAATTLIMTTLAGGATAAAMAPVMDIDWSALTPTAIATGTRPETLDFSVHSIRGVGTQRGDTAEGQRIVVRFDQNLPAGCWIRLWPHGLDTTTGQRFRQDGGGAMSDNQGTAYVVMALPDGTSDERMSFDALVVTQGASRYYLEQRFDRPPVVMGGGAVDLASPGDFTAWVCETGTAATRNNNQIIGGGTLLAIPADPENDDYALVDMTTVVAADVVTTALRNAAGAGDQLVITAPAFVATTEGDVAGSTQIAATVTNRRRNGLLDDVFDTTAPLSDITLMGRPLPMLERREVVASDPAAAPSGVVAAISGRAAHHEAIPAQLGHPGMPASAEIHGTGVALAGPAAAGTAGGGLVVLMRERLATNVFAFLNLARASLPAPVAPTGPTSFAAVLETMSPGVAGDGVLRAVVQTGNYTPGAAWDVLKASMEASLGTDLDALIDPFIADNTLAAAIDRLLRKTRDGAAQAAVSILSAIGQAEDLVYVETPAIDALAAGTGADTIDLVSALTARLAARPALRIVLCVPEKFLPGQPDRLETIRRSGIAAALQKLLDAAPNNVVLFTPTAGSGRKLHMASTTVVVDDVFLLSGTTHLWRRGLTFDTSLAVALFDQALTMGRPTLVRAARRQLIADRLNLPVNLVPDDPEHIRAAVARLNAAGGLQRVVPAAYAPAAETASPTDLAVWNPDGRPGGQEWFTVLRGLLGSAADDVNNAIR